MIRLHYPPGRVARRTHYLISLFFFLSLTPSFAQAWSPTARAWSNNSTVNDAICTATSYQLNVQLVSDGSEGAIITWEDARNGDGTTNDIYAQRVSGSGTMLWPTNGVAISTATGNKQLPQLISDGSGGAIITWSDNRSGNYDIYAQRVNSSGAVQWTANGVAICTATGMQDEQELSSDGSGGAVITWKDARNIGNNTDIYAQRVNGSGAVQWTANGVAICTVTELQYHPNLLGDGLGGAFIVWEDWRTSSTSNGDLYMQRLDSFGAAQLTANGDVISTATFNQADPRLISDGSGGAIIVWNDGRTADGFWDVYAQRVNSSGGALWTTGGTAISTATDSQYDVALASDGSGGAIFVWRDYRNGNDWNIYAQRVNSSGVGQWTANGNAICTVTGYKFYPQLASDGSGGAVMTWYENRNGNFDVYAQRVNSSGALQWTANAVPVCTQGATQYSPQLISDGSGGAIITWYDGRNSATTELDVYASRVYSSGVLVTAASDWSLFQ